MPDEMDESGNGFPREDTQERIKIAVQTDHDRFIKRWAWKIVGGIVGSVGISGLVATVMYAAGRASADSLQETDKKAATIEQAHKDLVETVILERSRTEKRFDNFEVKIDKIGENLYRMAMRSGVPAMAPPPPTIKPAPPERPR